MKRSSLLITSGLVVAIGGLGACQAVAGIQPRATDPLLTGCSLPGVAGTASTGNGRIRLVNLGTSATTANVDFCVRTSGGSWGRPVFRDGGNDGLCSTGLKYQQATVPFSVPVGKVDVKAIPAGQTCAANGTSEADGVDVGDATTVTEAGTPSPAITIVRWGNASGEKLGALAEEPGARSANNSAFRLVNALASNKSVSFGTASDPYVPTTLTSIGFSQPIAAGAVEPASVTNPLGTVDAQGYLQIIPAQWKFGVSLTSDAANSAIVVFDTQASSDLATMYVIGDPADNAHAVKGLYCQDGVSIAEAATVGTASVGTTAPAAADGGTTLTAQDNALLANCTPTKPPLISVDTFNVGLYGANAAFEKDRRPAIYAAIAQRTSDVMCVVEVDDDSDRANIASNAAQQYPYSYTLTTGLDTSPTLGSDVPSNPPTVAPCDPSIVPSTTIDNIYNCVNTKCSTNPGDTTLSGTLDQSTNCLSDNCAQPFLPIYNGSKTVNGCFDCILYYLTSEQKLSAGQTACTSDTRAPYAFLGQTPTMILSRYPLSNQHAYILPSTGFRRAVLQATVTLENNQKFDFFCTQLSTPLIDSSLPYVGNYGQDKPTAQPPENGWEDEQALQVPEVINFVKQQVAADGLPAIVTADWQSSLGADVDGGAAGLSSQSPEVLALLEDPKTGFVEARPPGYVQECDYCPATSANNPNAYDGTTLPYSFITTFLLGFDADSTQSRSLWGTSNTVTIPGSVNAPAPPGNVGPLADTWPLNVTILRPATK